ncbi:MAG TPA: hypothetical protein VGN00_03250, partial [Puia sp.]
IRTFTYMTVIPMLPEHAGALAEGAIGNGWMSHHQPEGEWLYGLDMGINPEFRGRGRGRSGASRTAHRRGDEWLRSHRIEAPDVAGAGRALNLNRRFFKRLVVTSFTGWQF